MIPCQLALTIRAVLSATLAHWQFNLPAENGGYGGKVAEKIFAATHALRTRCVVKTPLFYLFCNRDGGLKEMLRTYTRMQIR